MKTACEQVQERLSAWLDGELTAEERRQVAGHLKGCAACSRELDALSQLDAALGALAAPLPDKLPERVLARLQPPRRRYGWQSLAMAASLVLGITLGGALAQSFYPYAPKTLNNNGETLALEEFHDFPQGSLGAVMVSYQVDEANGS